MRRNTEADFWTWVIVGDTDSCWEWSGFTERNGYGRISWKGKKEGAHRVAYLLGHGAIPQGLQVLHTCDNPPCCNPSHLFVGTNADNMKDKQRKHRCARGENNANSTLTSKKVKAIRILHASGEFSFDDLAGMFGVTHRNISSVVRRKTWTHI